MCYDFYIVQRVWVVTLTLFFCGIAFAQTDTQPILDTERSLERMAAVAGMKSAFLQYLANDSIVFRPGPIKGREYWQKFDDSSKVLSRNAVWADISANGMMGYTTGNWRVYQKGKSEALAQFGQYVTIWEKQLNGTYQATVDIVVIHDKLPFYETEVLPKDKPTRDPNRLGWSPADASLGFTRLSMAPGGLGAAFFQYGADEIRFLRDGYPPLLGKKHVSEIAKDYRSIRFPAKINLYQSADLAYTWNPCQFANSEEGMEQGNCLQIWKLDNKKWQIVLAVFARIPNEIPPTLKTRDRKTAAH